MSRKLSDQDRKAVDVLLDSTVLTHTDMSLKPHVDAAERVFKLLDLLPVAEPPADLMARTFERISEAVGMNVRSMSPRIDHRPNA